MSSARWWRRYSLRHRGKNKQGEQIRILGIDPGNVCGYGIIETANRHSPPQAADCIYVTSGQIVTSQRKPLPMLLRDLYTSLIKIIREYRPHEAVVEKAFFAKNAKAALSLGERRGIALLAAASEGLNIYEYSVLEVKKAITGYGRAEKRQVQDMVKRILHLTTRIPNLTEDAADALALAICHMNTIKLREAINRS
jgi:crossover junction endodeoxyribonuclease RuvC